MNIAIGFSSLFWIRFILVLWHVTANVNVMHIYLVYVGLILNECEKGWFKVVLCMRVKLVNWKQACLGKALHFIHIPYTYINIDMCLELSSLLNYSFPQYTFTSAVSLFYVLYMNEKQLDPYRIFCCNSLLNVN